MGESKRNGRVVATTTIFYDCKNVPNRRSCYGKTEKGVGEWRRWLKVRPNAIDDNADRLSLNWVDDTFTDLNVSERAEHRSSRKLDKHNGLRSIMPLITFSDL